MTTKQNTEEFPEAFNAATRDKAREHADHPLTAEYIERLERIVRLAGLLYQHVNYNGSIQATDINDLFTALGAVHFLDES